MNSVFALFGPCPSSVTLIPIGGFAAFSAPSKQSPSTITLAHPLRDSAPCLIDRFPRYYVTQLYRDGV